MAGIPTSGHDSPRHGNHGRRRRVASVESAGHGGTAMKNKLALIAALATLGAIALGSPGGAAADPTGVCPDGMFLSPVTTQADAKKDGTRDGTGGDGFVCKKYTTDPSNPHGGPDDDIEDNLPLF